MKDASQGNSGGAGRTERNFKSGQKNNKPEPVNPFQAKLMELKKKFKD